MKLSARKDEGIIGPMDMDPCSYRRLIPETDLDKDILRHIVRNAVEQMGDWTSFDDDYKMQFVVDAHVEVRDDGTIPALLDASPKEFNPATFLSGPVENVLLHVETLPSGKLKAIWTIGKDSNYVEAGCCVVRKYS